LLQVRVQEPHRKDQRRQQEPLLRVLELRRTDRKLMGRQQEPQVHRRDQRSSEQRRVPSLQVLLVLLVQLL
jgi:hypothetical protein